MNKKLNIGAIAIITAGLVVLGFTKLSRHTTAKKIMAWEQQVEKHAGTTGEYTYFPNDSHVLISDAVAENINTVIPYLDSNIFNEGRDVNQTADPDFAQAVIAGAEQGGYDFGRTTFKEDYFKDDVTATVTVMYDKSSLKLLKIWGQPAKANHFEYTENRYAYTGKIKVEYKVNVDGEEYNGVHYQQSQISSPMDLLYKYKSK